jgi:ubiquitin-conjugating enzyme E2 G1
LVTSEGGFFKAHMTFPAEYPNLPPKLRFKPRSLWHPNGIVSFCCSLSLYRRLRACVELGSLFAVYWETGDVCISILHPPGEDQYGYEQASERWLPIHTVESILVSVISMLSSPNDESPANIDAAVCNLHATALSYHKYPLPVCLPASHVETFF